jgi:arylformamidase
MAEGASVNVGAIGMSLHNGTHADAPFHFDATGAPIDRVSLDAYIGPAVVIDLTERLAGKSNAEIAVTDLDSVSGPLEQAPRLLFKTGTWSDSRTFPSAIPVMGSGVVEWLHNLKVKLVGFDVPSVDPIDAKNLSNHYALGAAGIAIIESLDLSRVEAGVYQLSALPLKIAGADAGPVRAVLWR